MTNAEKGARMKLYGTLTSPYVRKVRAFLHEKGWAHDFVIEAPSDAAGNVARLNPLGKIPVLVRDDGEVVFESMMLIEYLARVRAALRRHPLSRRRLSRRRRSHHRRHRLRHRARIHRSALRARLARAISAARAVAGADEPSRVIRRNSTAQIIKSAS